MERSLTQVEPVTGQILEFAKRHPDSIALDSGDQRLGYGELSLRADRFAGYLTELGVAPGDAVAICMERSFDWIAAALGIMRAGGAYVPLDSAWPESRLRFAVEDSGAAVLVARTPLLDRLQVKARGIDPARDAASIITADAAVLIPIAPSSLAYVIYTSGSTGVPKGVEITHANLAHLIRWHIDAFGVTQHDRASHLAGLGFDASVWEVWPNLCAGATVCLPDEAVRSSPELIQQWMIRERVTIGFVPTVHAVPMMEMEWPGETTLRFLLTGGDALSRGPVRRLPFDVINNYGPTECTVVATSSVLKPGISGLPPIGRPIADTSVYLLTEDGLQVSDGSVGEIYIGGGSVGRGYRNLPDSSQRYFLPDPFAETPGARMYRTGDRGMRRPDGEIEFRGRADRQTKIRGQRVELDEIGTILNKHPGVEFATVISNASESGENRLVAYILPKKIAGEPTARELQQLLQRNLPDYMIPAVFVRLNALPLSANGKLDLTMLERPSDAQLLEGNSAQTTATPIEEKLLAVVREVLKQDAIGLEDNFFLAGGHSLLGMQLVMLLRKAFGVEITLRQLFEAPTVERLASLIEIKINEDRLTAIWKDLLGQKQIDLDENFFDSGGTSALVPALQKRIAAEFERTIPILELFNNPTVRKQAQLTLEIAKAQATLPPGVLELQPNASRSIIFWAHYQSVNLAKAIGDNHRFLSVTLTAEDIALLGPVPDMQEIAAYHMRKIVATQPKGPYVIGGQCLGGILAYEIVSQMKAAGHEVSLLIMLDSHNPSFVSSCDTIGKKLRNLGYLAARAWRIGPRLTITYFRERLHSGDNQQMGDESYGQEIKMAHDMIATASYAYRPQRYDGRILLLLADERPPHVNFLPDWQTVASSNLLPHYVDSHHRNLLDKQNAKAIADAIVSNLVSAPA
jgi:amino acid adenylation domain-containing protein